MSVLVLDKGTYKPPKASARSDRFLSSSFAITISPRLFFAKPPLLKGIGPPVAVPTPQKLTL